MKIIPMEAKLLIGAAAVALAVALPQNCTAAGTTVTLQIESLQREYTRTAEEIQARQQHLLRLEGAISILTQFKDDVATAAPVLQANDEATTAQVLQPTMSDPATTAPGNAHY